MFVDVFLPSVFNPVEIIAAITHKGTASKCLLHQCHMRLVLPHWPLQESTCEHFDA